MFRIDARSRRNGTVEGSVSWRNASQGLHVKECVPHPDCNGSGMSRGGAAQALGVDQVNQEAIFRHKVYNFVREQL